MTSDRRLAELLAALPPAPDALVARAARIPDDHPGLQEAVVRAESDAAFRDALVQDTAAALERAGLGTDRALIETLRGHLRQDGA